MSYILLAILPDIIPATAEVPKVSFYSLFHMAKLPAQTVLHVNVPKGLKLYHSKWVIK